MADLAELQFSIDKMKFDLESATSVTMVQQPKLTEIKIENLDGTTTSTFRQTASKTYDPDQPTTTDPITGEVTNSPFEMEYVPVVGEYSCEALQAKIQVYVDEIIALIAAEVETVSLLMEEWAPLLTLPSDPLKILTWAAKVVGGPAATQVALAAHIITDIAKLAVSAAQLAVAAASAAQRLAACMQAAIIAGINATIDALLTGAAILMGKAEDMASQILSDNLTALGADELISQIESIEDSIGAVDSAMDDLKAAGEAMQDAADKFDSIQLANFGPPAIDSPDLPGDIDAIQSKITQREGLSDAVTAAEEAVADAAGKSADAQKQAAADLKAAQDNLAAFDKAESTLTKLMPAPSDNTDTAPGGP